MTRQTELKKRWANGFLNYKHVHSPTYFNTIISDPPSTNLSNYTFNQEFLLMLLLPALLGSYDIQFPSWSHPVWPLCIKAKEAGPQLARAFKAAVVCKQERFPLRRRALPWSKDGPWRRTSPKFSAISTLRSDGLLKGTWLAIHGRGARPPVGSPGATHKVQGESAAAALSVDEDAGAREISRFLWAVALSDEHSRRTSWPDFRAGKGDRAAAYVALATLGTPEFGNNDSTQKGCFYPLNCVWEMEAWLMTLVGDIFPCISKNSGYVCFRGFPGSSVGKEYACRARNPCLILGSGRSPEEGNGKPLQYSCLENPMDRGAWRATAHGVARVGHDLVTKPPCLF